MCTWQRRIRAVALLAPGLVAVLGARPAAAGEPEVARARDAYDRGVKAESRGDHGAAARAFAEADALAPSVASLEAALESTMRADDAALGAELLERGEARVTDAGLSKTMAAARRRFENRTGRVRVDCAFAKSCLVAVDGSARDATRAVFVSVGAHSVVVERDGVRLDRLVEVRPGEVVVLAPEEAPRAGPPAAVSAEPRRRTMAAPGISPVWFYVGLGLTAVAGGVSIASGLDASAKHTAFDRDCGAGGSGPVPGDCAARADAGASADTRTNVALVVTGSLAAVSAVTAIAFVRWSRPKEEGRVHAAPWFASNAGGASLSVALP